MKADELRIGNLVIFSFNGKADYHTIVAKDLKVMSTYPDNEEYYPVPLSKEILISAGFVESKNSWFKKIFAANIQDSITEFSVNLKSGSACLSDSYEEIPAFLGKQIKFAHELQNTWRYFTGVELIA